MLFLNFFSIALNIQDYINAALSLPNDRQVHFVAYIFFNKFSKCLVIENGIFEITEFSLIFLHQKEQENNINSKIVPFIFNNLMMVWNIACQIYFKVKTQ